MGGESRQKILVLWLASAKTQRDKSASMYVACFGFFCISVMAVPFSLTTFSLLRLSFQHHMGCRSKG